MRLTCFSNQSIESNESNENRIESNQSISRELDWIDWIPVDSLYKTVFLKARVSYNARL